MRVLAVSTNVQLVKSSRLAFSIILLCLAYQASAQNKPVANQPSVQVSVKIVDQQYCKGSRGSFDSLQMNLLLRYTNASKKNLIIYRYAHTVHRQMISSNLTDANLRRYQIDLSISAFTEGTPAVRDEDSPNESFVVLPPGAYLEVPASTRASIFLSKKRAKASNETLSTGNYLLQVEVSTWPGSASLAEKLRERWNTQGILLAGTATSVPTEFIINKNVKFIKGDH